LIDRGIREGLEGKNQKVLSIFEKAKREFEKATAPGGICPIR